MKPDKKQIVYGSIALVYWLVLVFLFFTGCKKESQVTPATNVVQPKSCTIDITKFKDVLWIPIDTAVMADIKFYSNGNHYQEGQADVTWSQAGCDSIKVNRATMYGAYFYYVINSVTSDTLKLINPFFGQLTYHK